MKVIALKEFEKYTDKERNNCKVKEGDTWETTEERAKYLLSKGVVEIIEEQEPVEYQNIEDKKPKKTSKKK